MCSKEGKGSTGLNWGFIMDTWGEKPNNISKAKIPLSLCCVFFFHLQNGKKYDATKEWK